MFFQKSVIAYRQIHDMFVLLIKTSDHASFLLCVVRRNRYFVGNVFHALAVLCTEVFSKMMVRNGMVVYASLRVRLNVE